ncbi:hypothetical protein LIER_12706 [Lithospermum erythrorhizon]|uniref:Tify domain-containing protein n=1 Tax=Lithospermum erythrorhizon TaxID=34254 RepID=A0AAV3PUC1_LITER
MFMRPFHVLYLLLVSFNLYMFLLSPTDAMGFSFLSFPDKGFWMPKSGDNLIDGETVFDSSSTIDNKGVHQWFSGTAEPDIFPNKRQAVQTSGGKPTSGVTMSSPFTWESVSGFQSVPNQFMDRLFGPELTINGSLADSNVSHVVTMNSSATKRGSGEEFGTSSVGLSMSYNVEDAECVSYGGIRKTKVNQVKDSEIDLHAPSQQNVNMSLHQAYNGGEESTYVTMSQLYGKEVENDAFMNHQAYSREDGNIGPIVSSFEKANDNISLSHAYSKDNIKAVPFGGYQDEPDIDSLHKRNGSYDLLCNNQASTPRSGTQAKKDPDISNANSVPDTSQAMLSKPDPVSKIKSETKPARKEAPNSFPSNVRSLITTGILDGVPVKYVSVSREELCGIIKGSGYLCGCKTCNYSKALNAYEFERHAGCKTKHPNNHIYFENGKTIYQIVQELRSTPESQLFDAIQTVCGSSINQKAFRIWKESFQAATRELQRIYGKDALNL